MGVMRRFHVPAIYAACSRRTSDRERNRTRAQNRSRSVRWERSTSPWRRVRCRDNPSRFKSLPMPLCEMRMPSRCNRTTGTSGPSRVSCRRVRTRRTIAAGYWRGWCRGRRDRGASASAPPRRNDRAHRLRVRYENGKTSAISFSVRSPSRYGWSHRNRSSAAIRERVCAIPETVRPEGTDVCGEYQHVLTYGEHQRMMPTATSGVLVKPQAVVLV